MGNAYLFRMPSGIPGVVDSPEQATIEPQLIDTGTPPTAFGIFVKLVSGKIQPIASGDVATVIYGMLVRPFPYQEPSVNEAIGAATPDPNSPCNVLKRGYMTVLLGNGTAAKGAQVYVRKTAYETLAVGSIEDDTDSANVVAAAGCFFTGPADTAGNVKVAYNL